MQALTKVLEAISGEALIAHTLHALQSMATAAGLLQCTDVMHAYVAAISSFTIDSKDKAGKPAANAQPDAQSSSTGDLAAVADAADGADSAARPPATPPRPANASASGSEQTSRAMRRSAMCALATACSVHSRT